MSKKPPYSENEILRLIELYRENKVVLQSSFKSSITNKKKQELWQHIVDEVNAIGMKNRTVKEVTHKWKDLKSLAKKDLSARKNPKTGGGKPPKEGGYTDVILEIIGEDAPSVCGVPGGGVESIIGKQAGTAEENAAFISQNDETTEQSLQPSTSAANSPTMSVGEEVAEEPPRKKLKLLKAKEEKALSREELHRILLIEDIAKSRLKQSNLELEKPKLELEIRKLRAKENARQQNLMSCEHCANVSVLRSTTTANIQQCTETDLPVYTQL